VWPWLPAAAAKRALATLSGARNACVIGRGARHLEQVGPQLLAPDADRATEQIVDRTLATEPWGQTATEPWGQTEFQVNLKLGLTTKSPPKSPRSDHEKPRQLGRKMKPRDWKSGRAWTVGSDPAKPGPREAVDPAKPFSKPFLDPAKPFLCVPATSW